MEPLEVSKQNIKQLVLERMDMTRELMDQEVYDVIDSIMGEYMAGKRMSVKQQSSLRRKVFCAIRRFDVLQELLDDNTITEIMVNGANHIFIEREGKIVETELQFESEERLNDIIQQMVAKANRIVNEANPIVDARLMDGSRINAVISPIALDGSTLTIRKFGKHSMTMEKLIEYGSLTKEVANILSMFVVAKYNIFISGGTGSGKTTFLNVLSNYIPCDERIVTIEDSAELQIRNVPNLVRLEVRNGNVEGKNEVSIRDLIKASLRMRPDRIIVGEVRDSAAVDMLMALNTGHDGSLSTGHANSPEDMLSRLETLVLLGSDIPLLAARKQIASAIDIIIHLGRLRDKSRKVLEIVEVLGVENNEIVCVPLYRFQEQGMDQNDKVIGELQRTENQFANVTKLSRAGVTYGGL